MNVAIIFAGGTGQRMNTKTRPKQFLELHGKPIIIYTLEQFENHELIDSAPHAKQTLYMSLPTQTEGCIVIRMKES